MNHLNLDRIVPSWSDNVRALAIATLKEWVADRKDITSLDLKMHMRSIVGPGTNILQVDVSRFLQFMMKFDNKPHIKAEEYTSKQMRSGALEYLMYSYQGKPQPVEAKAPCLTTVAVEALEAAKPEVKTVSEPTKDSLWTRIVKVFKP